MNIITRALLSAGLRYSIVLAAVLMIPAPAAAQTTLTGAAQFSAAKGGALYEYQFWNTLGLDGDYDLWLALDANAASPLNGPDDADANISIPLAAGQTYTFYTFAQEGDSTTFGYTAMNLFFDGNNSTPAISVYGALNNSTFEPDSANTLTLQGTNVPGSGATGVTVDGVVVALTAYVSNKPAVPPGNVCQSFSFTPGSIPNYFGSFTLKVFPEASLNPVETQSSPFTKITLNGSGFAPLEKIDIYTVSLADHALASITADAGGSFSVSVPVPQYPLGALQYYALGTTSGFMGLTSLAIVPRLVVSPHAVAPGALASIKGLGFAADERVEIFLNEPQQSLGFATANGRGSFGVAGALNVEIPANAAAGPNGLTAVGQLSGATATTSILVQ
jgi:hypothetical protein